MQRMHFGGKEIDFVKEISMNPLLRFTIGFFLRVLLPFSLYMAINSYGIDERDLSAADRREQIIPDLPGYLTMKCDFHMHTFLSDGLVSPTTRVGEAYLGGLDAIAITDHVEFRPHHLLGDEAEAMDQAKALAERLGLILIPGCEITKGISPGHFNALFITDIDAINQREAEKAIEAAYGQGAFVFYNHPKPETAPMEVLWSDFHQKLASRAGFRGSKSSIKRPISPCPWLGTVQGADHDGLLGHPLSHEPGVFRGERGASPFDLGFCQSADGRGHS